MGFIYIAFGANLSNPKTTFRVAIDLLEKQGVEFIKISGLWQSPSWPPGQGHPDYLNGAAQIAYDGSAQSLLEVLMLVENDLGRARSERNAPRTLDLDILDFKGQILSTPSLTLPHPRMLSRGFVLFPLMQIGPDWQDPTSGQPIIQFVAKLPYQDVSAMKYVGTLV